MLTAVRSICPMANSGKSTAKQTLLQSAVAILAYNPGASLQDIAAQAGVGRATLYRHFSSREALVRELAMEAIAAIDQVTTQVRAQELPAKEALLAFLEGVVPLGDRFHFLGSESSVYTEPEVSMAYKRQMQELDDFVTTLKKEGVVAPDIPNAWVSTAIDMLIWAGWSAVESGDIARNDAAKLAYRTLTQGLS
ncbi:MAG: TetR/AcrR family transcriptional regulator [Cyanobacteria bacterium P01_F01_bin.150]